MDELLLYRSLGVPDIITGVDTRKRAATAEVGVLLGEDRLISGDYPDRVGMWLTHVASKGQEGHLDGLLGGYESPEDVAERLANQGSPAEFSWDIALRLNTALLKAVQAFVRAHPFKDEAGHYFS